LGHNYYVVFTQRWSLEGCHWVEMSFTDYSIDVAQTHFNIDVIKTLKGISSRLQESLSTNPFCIVILSWVTCLYQFPPCEGFKLIIPCTESCEVVVVEYFGLCLRDILNSVNSKTDSILETPFPSFGCQDYNDYYVDFEARYFTQFSCFAPIPTPIGKCVQFFDAWAM